MAFPPAAIPSNFSAEQSLLAARRRLGPSVRRSFRGIVCQYELRRNFVSLPRLIYLVRIGWPAEERTDEAGEKAV